MSTEEEKNNVIPDDKTVTESESRPEVQTEPCETLPEKSEILEKSKTAKTVKSTESCEPSKTTKPSKTWRQRFVANRHKWWGVFCTFMLLALPVLLARWMGFEQWQREAFIFSVVLTVLFLHIGTFVLTVFVPIIASFLLQSLFDIPIYWTLPTLIFLGFSLCFRFSGKHTQMLHPGCKNCIFRILYRSILRRE